MNLSPLLHYLEDQGLGIAGKTLFRDNMPGTVPQGILLLLKDSIGINPYTSIHDGLFRVVVRAQSEDKVRELANKVSDTLNLKGGVELGNMKFRYIYPIHEPMVFPRFRGGEIEASVDFDCAFTLKI